MGNFFCHPINNIKQWFIVDAKNPGQINRLIYHFDSNYFIHNWLKERGYSENKNCISRKDIDDLIYILNKNDEVNVLFQDISNSFFLRYIYDENYFKDINDYKLYIKNQNVEILNKLNNLVDEEKNNISYIIIEGKSHEDNEDNWLHDRDCDVPMLLHKFMGMKKELNHTDF